jgi:Ca2+:H+ antiporter
VKVSEAVRVMDGTQRLTVVAAAALTLLAGVVTAAGAGDVVRFVLAGLALAALAAVIGQAIDQVGDRLGPSATGLLQSTLGNLPELFVALFALNDGLVDVVRAALVGSILANALLVLGLAFVAGGLRHGVQKFDPEEPRLYGSLLLLVVTAMLVPTLAAHLGTPAAAHVDALSQACAVVLLIVYTASIVFALSRHTAQSRHTERPQADPERTQADASTAASSRSAWPLSLSVPVLAAASLGAAFASAWFVNPLQSATAQLGLSEAFTGLVVVAIASNAVEHVVGIRFALKAKPEFAISTTLNSPLQVALFLIPVLVLISPAIGPTALTLVFPVILVVALAASTLVVAVIVYDGEYTWIEGVALIGLYCMIAAAFWWG